MDLTISEQKSRLMEEIIKYKPMMAKLTICLEQAEQYANIHQNQRQYHSNVPHKNSQFHNSNSNDIATLVEKAAMSLPIYDQNPPKFNGIN